MSPRTRERRTPLTIALALAFVAAAVVVALVTTQRHGSPADRSAPSPTPVETSSPFATQPGRSLTWSDEFEGPEGSPPDPDNWTAETGGSGWGNDELQYYTDSPDNAALDGRGNLAITVHEIDGGERDLTCWYGPCQYTSARLITAGKQQFQYGRMEMRVQLPAGGGLWPAVWALGENIGDVGWPQSGEIDFLEFVGNRPDEIFGTVHGPGYSGGQSFGGFYDFGQPATDAWRDVAVEWEPGLIVWEVDGTAYHSAMPADVAPNEWVFDQPFWFITNMAVGGNFGGPVDESVEFPRTMLIDYLRVYQEPAP